MYGNLVARIYGKVLAGYTKNLKEENNGLSGEEIHNQADNAASWCELASVGDTYHFDGGMAIEIKEIEHF